MQLINKIGKSFNDFIGNIFGIIGFFGIILNNFTHVFLRKNRYINLFIESFLDFIHLIAIKAFYTTSILSVLIGVFLILQMSNYFNISSSNIDIVIELIVVIIIRELGPLLSGIILIIKVQSFFSIRYSLMRNNKEFEILRSLGINIYITKLIPFVLAFSISLLTTIFYFDLLVVIFSYLVLLIKGIDISFIKFLELIIDKLSIIEVSVTLLKGLVGGLILGVVTIYFATKVDKLSIISSTVSSILTYSIILFIMINFSFSLLLY
ncbi:MAG: ABC transporter permease [Campylobacterota bacterium]|nr:ABC transporter permease [Campylobacterota bacterium]